MNIGLLKFRPATENTDLIAEPIKAALMSYASNQAQNYLVTEIDPEYSDSEEFCRTYEVATNLTANCLILEAKRADRVWHAACLVPFGKRADINGVIRRQLGARQVSFAAKDFAVSASQMEYGSITIIGLPTDWPLLIDETIIEVPHLVIGGGLRKSKLLISGPSLLDLPNAISIEEMSK